MLERCAIAAISDELYAAFVNHETVTVWRYAFDIARLRRYVSEVQADVDISVERRVDSVDGPDVLITFDVPFVCGTRLDRLLSKELGVSRAIVQNWFEVGAAQSPCGERVAMNKPVCDRQQLLLRAESCGERARPLASARSSKG